jgi:hypothetical protein
MSFLNWPTEQVLSNRRVQEQRRRVALNLIEKFGRVFPQVTYQLFWDSPSLNAQAWMLESNRYVRVYGGLVRHSAISKYGLALTLAHETGHHLGGSPHDPQMRWMTWQGQADYWAAQVAMPLVFGPKAQGMILRGAREILSLHEALGKLTEEDEPELSASCRHQIFRAAIANSDMPSCAKQAFQECSGCDYRMA